MPDSGIQIQSASPAQTVRTIQLVVRTDQNKNVLMDVQVVAVADKFGNLVDYGSEQEWREIMLLETRAIRIGIQQLLTDNMENAGETAVDILELANDFGRLERTQII
jgi:hypothetical protein